MFAAARPLVSSSSAPYEALKGSPYFWLIWNLYLTDKLAPLNSELLKQEGIVEIVAILPEGEDSEVLHLGIPSTVLTYHHSDTPTLPKEQYDAVAKKIDEVAKGSQKPRGVLVFCNNGFQRSIPFLVYYMMKYHGDEFSTVDKAMGYIFTAIRSKNTFEEKLQSIHSIKSLFN